MKIKEVTYVMDGCNQSCDGLLSLRLLKFMPSSFILSIMTSVTAAFPLKQLLFLSTSQVLPALVPCCWPGCPLSSPTLWSALLIGFVRPSTLVTSVDRKPPASAFSYAAFRQNPPVGLQPACKKPTPLHLPGWNPLSAASDAALISI